MAKLPPQNLEAEQSILGALMLEPEAFDQVGDLLVPEDFYLPVHHKTFSAIRELHQNTQAIDIITVTNLLEKRGELASIGGPDFLVSLLDKTISAANVKAYAQIVKDKSLLRRVIHTSTEIIEEAYEQDFPDVSSFIDRTEGKILKIGETKSKTGLIGSMEIVKSSIQRIEELYKQKADFTGVASGFTELDKMTYGFHPGEFTIIAARPSMGKTAFSLNIAQHVAFRLKKTVAYFSLEMGKESLMMRILSSESKVNMSDMRSGRIADSAWPNLINSASMISEAPLYIDDTSGLSPFEIRSRCRRLKSEFGLDLVMIDYLQLMDLKIKVESRERAVSEISKSLKSLSKELQIPVVALAQLNRGVEGRSDRRPMLSDLRESGSIEQDADVIMMLYRDDYYDKEDPEKQGHAEVIIGKQRNGPTGTVKLKFEAKYNRFVNAEPDVSHFPPPQAPPQMSQRPPGQPPRNYAPV
ncbi:MAG TPA: replicative DNA helicase [Pseudobdellovibrionaceae bacterium]|nr:replicative DNA helicase [Pseudobdellovibrionaceae bacterium]